MQLFELDPDGPMRPVTELNEPVRAAAYLPGQRRAVIEVDAGGNELGQLYVVDLERAAPSRWEDLAALTSQAGFAHHLAGVSPDARHVAFLSNRRNNVDFDLWSVDLESRESRCLYDAGGYCMPSSGFSPDGRYLVFVRPGERPLDHDLVLVEVSTGRSRTILAHPDEPAQVGGPVWDSPTSFFVSSSVGSDFERVVRVDLESDAVSIVPGTGETCDATPLFARGDHLVLVENVDGHSRVTRRRGSSAPEEVELPDRGVLHWEGMFEPRFSPDGERAYVTWQSPRMPPDVWMLEAGAAARRLTHCAEDFSPDDFAEAQSHTAVSFDGEEISLYCLRPRGMELPPVVVVIHGGPESQSRHVFNPVVQSLVCAGFAVVVPNVRGSTGYGKRFAALDDTVKRLDSVRDLEAIHSWIGDHGLDASRVALYGGSYGGYMVLAGLAFQPHLWAAGVDIVGISNLVTFLQNTSPYRRRLREMEYGSLEHDRDFLESASPLNRVDDIEAPLFVIHGRNDPRVPVGEAEQLVERLARRGVTAELLVYDDEGHGLVRLANRLDAYPNVVAFLTRVLST